MNEKFQEYLMGILEKTGEFLGDQLPDIANQILKYGMAHGIIWSIVFLVGLVISILFAINIYKKSDNGFVGGVPCVIILFAPSVPMFISGYWFAMHLDQVIKIYLAPKLYLLEYAASLVK